MRNIIDENPRLHVSFAHNYSHYDNWIHVLSSLSTNEDELKYFKDEMEVLKSDIEELNMLVRDFMMTLLFEPDFVRNDIALNSDILFGMKRVKVNEDKKMPDNK